MVNRKILSLVLVLTFIVLLSGVGGATILSNTTTLTFITSLTPQAHFINLTATANNWVNITINNSVTLGSLDVIINGVTIGNVSTTDGPTKTFIGITNYTFEGLNNITFAPSLASSATIVQSAIYYTTECGVVPINNCRISLDTTFNTGIYRFNGSTNGAIQLNGNNIILNGNGSTIIGNYSSGSGTYYAIHSQSRSNSTITNFSINNYNRGIILSGGGRNNTVKYVNFTNGLKAIDLLSNSSLITNNSIYNMSDASIDITSGSFMLINNNLINNSRYSIKIQSEGDDINITNNILTGQQGSSPILIYILSGSTNNYIHNNTLFNSSNGITILGNNNRVLNNLFFNLTTPITINSNNNLIQNNNISQIYLRAIDIEGTNYSVFDNNYIIGLKQALRDNVFIVNSSYNNFSGNFLQFSQYQFNVNGIQTTNLLFINNTLRDSDQGSRLFGNNISFINNSIINISANYDFYDIGLKLFSVTNGLLYGNNFTQMTSTGIGYINSSNLNISNNLFSFVNFNQRNKYVANDYTDPPCAIRGYEVYKSFIGQGLENSKDDNYTYLSQFRSYNVTLSNNIFDSNTQCYLWDTDNSVINQDLNDFWFRSVRIATYQNGNYDFYINNLFNNLSMYTTDYIDNKFTVNYYGTNRPKINITINKQYIYLLNVNITQTYNNTVFNQSSSLIYYSNGSTLCSTISSCNGQINITLSPNNYSYVLDNFNLTEGINRQFSPIWFSSSSSTSKHIASNLSQTISGVQVIVNVDSCDTVGTITYTPDSGANVQIFTVGSYSCTNNRATLTLNNIEPAQNSNVLNIEYNAASQTSCNNTIVALLGFPALIGLVGSVILIGLIIMLLTGYAKRDGGGELFSKDNLIIGFVALILIGVLVIIGVLVVSTLCSTI